MAKSERFEMRVTKRWLKDVDFAKEGVNIRTKSDFVYLATEAICRGDVVPTALLAEAAGIIEDVQEHLRSGGVKRNRVLAEKLDDAITAISASEDLELPEGLVWPKK